MTIRNPAEIRGFLRPGQVLMGLDPGTRTIGVAVSDSRLMLASPLTTIKRTKFSKDAEALRRLARERDAGAMVIGLPLEMDGTEGRRAQAAREFGRILGDALALPVLYQDERLSTAAVERTLIGEADLSRGKRAEVVDRAAAAYILQGVLDRLYVAGGTA